LGARDAGKPLESPVMLLGAEPWKASRKPRNVDGGRSPGKTAERPKMLDLVTLETQQ